MKRFLILIVVSLCAGNLCAYSIFFSPMNHFGDWEYAVGMLDARSGNYRTAFRILEFGSLRNPNDLRFLTALAGVSYKMGDRDSAKKYLFQALRLRPKDAYANQFLGSLFLMDGNIEACLKYWNRIGRPQIEQIQMQPKPPIDPTFLDHALVMSPASSLQVDEFLETQRRLNMMGIFRKYEFQLKPKEQNDNFDLILRPRIRKGTLESKMKLAALVGRGLITDTIQPEFHNISGSAVSFLSLISWDKYRNRFQSSFSFPFADQTDARIRIFADFRHETWRLQEDVDLWKWEAGVDFQGIWNGRSTWNSGAKTAFRRYENPAQSDLSTFRDGLSAQIFAGSEYAWIRIPERRLTIDASAEVEFGTFLSTPEAESFLKVVQSIDLQWYLKAKGDDYAIASFIRAGKGFGSVPFDEYFELGADRENDLILRSHRSSMERKGENPFSSAFVLFGSSITKNILDQSRFKWRLSPFFDAARIRQTDLWNGDRWFLDTGIQSSFQVFGSPELKFTFGKDLRTGRNVYYFSVMSDW
jgi:hypothetical protein